MKKVFSVLMITMLMVSSLFSVTAFASGNGAQASQNQQGQKDWKQPPQGMKNQVIGKITAISESSVTISVAEMKKPDNTKGNKFDGNPPEMPNNQTNNQGNGQNDFKPSEEQIAEMKKKMEEMFTLTGDTKTIDISSATFGNERGWEKRNKDSNSTNNNSNDNANNQNNKKTYKDYAVGDYITIELTGENTNVAKRVREAGPMGGGPRGQFGKDNNGKDGKDKNKNNN